MHDKYESACEGLCRSLITGQKLVEAIWNVTKDHSLMKIINEEHEYLMTVMDEDEEVEAMKNSEDYKSLLDIEY